MTRSPKFLSILALAAASTVLSMPASAKRPSRPAPLFRAGEVVVRYRDDAPQADIDAMAHRLALTRTSRIGGGRFEVLKLPAVMDVAGAIRTLARDPSVALAQPNYLKRRFQAAAAPNDPDFSQQWGLDNTGQANFVSGGPAGLPGADMDLLAAWDPADDGSFTQTGNGSVTVAVVDSGFQTDHPDFTHANGSSNFVGGMNFTASPANADVSPASGDGHGTEVAGVLGAVGNNGAGVAGAIWNVKMMPLKFGFDTASEIAALQYAAANGAQIVNASYGGPIYDPAELNELQDLNNRGILVVTSAGNENLNADFAGADYPAVYGLPNILAVAATNRQDGIASFSTFGPTTVPLAAPGLQIVSTELGSAYSASPGLYGTSFSAPMAAGAAALIKSYNATATATELKSRLIEGASPGLDTTNPVNALVTGGRVDAANSMNLGGTGPSLVIKPVTVSSYLASNPDANTGSSSTITVPVVAPARIANDSSNSCYTDPNNASTGNCVLNPGDTANLQITVQNLWHDALGVAGTLTADNGVTVGGGGSASFGDIPHLGSATGTFPITVPSSLQGHQYLHFTLTLTATGGYSATRNFTLEVGALANNVTVPQVIGTNLYDNFHTWTFTLGSLPQGQNALSFEAYAANDVDIIVSYQSPPQYMIDANGYTDPNAYYYYNVPDAQTGAGFGPGGYTEYVNIPNPQPGVYYVTVVNYDQINSTYQLVAFTNTGGVGAAMSSTVEAQQAVSDNGGGAFGPALLGVLAILAALKRAAGLGIARISTNGARGLPLRTKAC
jgi:hypothetical protein